MDETIRPAKIWKRVLAVILDLITVFWGAGMLIARATGETTDDGFSLNGGSAFFLFGIIAAYFRDRPTLRRRHAVGSHSSY